MSTNDVVLSGISAVLVLLVVTACAPKGGKSSVNASGGGAVVTACVLPVTEANTIQGHWATTPAKVSLHVGDFDPSEVNAIQAGGASWNTFFQASKSFNMFDMGPPGGGNISSNAQSTPTCGSGTLADGTVLYKRFSNWTHNAAAIAVTTTCFTPNNNGGLATIFNAIMEFNYVNFYVASAGRFPDMQSIAVHELGHLLGLDHTCGPLGRPNQAKPFTACPDVNADPNNPVIATVMFPQVFFDPSGAGEVKQILTADDQGRANCAYTPGN
ncbi:MAG: hypothetical protein HY074_02375 [Deltaproteobacteria bacterium]|nr:hypothetical protein [Deltaproteobacteria bacterium]